MKNALFALLALLPACVFAQQHHTILPQPKTQEQAQDRQLMSELMHRNHTITAQKTTGVQERLVGMADVYLYPSGDVVNDSQAFVYSGSRHSEFDYDQYFYGYQYPSFNFNPFDQLSDLLPSVQYTDILSVDFDTAISYAPDTSQTLQWYGTTTATYNSANELVDYNAGATDHDVSVYDNSNNIISAVRIGNDTTTNTTDTTQFMMFAYDAQNHLTSKTKFLNHPYFGWVPIQGYRYANDANGNATKVFYISYVGGQTADTLKVYSCTYDAANRLTSMRTMQYSTGGLQVLDTITYTGSNTFSTTWTELDGSGDTSYHIVKYLNAQNLPDSVSFKDGAFTFTYDSYNNPVTENEWNSNTLYYASRYYYETYDPTAIKNVAAKTDDFKIYPNPTTGNVLISSAANSNQSLHVFVVNALGQQVQHVAYTNGGAPFTLSLNGLANGMYFITLQDANGNVLHRQQVVKE